jgi:signal peptide peptidase SppA
MMDLWLTASDDVVRTTLATITALELARRSGSFATAGRAPSYTVRGRTALVATRGVLVANGPDWYEEYGVLPMRLVRERVRAAAADGAIDEIVLQIDSPGGTVAGLEALVETVRGLKKPIAAHIETLGASAAYWLASATGRITAEPGAIVGSIGVISTVIDASKYYEDAGLKVHVIRSAPAKGGIVFGERVTDENLAPIRARIAEVFDTFVAAVRAGRKLDTTQLEAVTTGETWSAKRARELGLVDAIALTDDPAEDPTDAPFPIAAAAVEAHEMNNPDKTENLMAELAREKAQRAALEAQLAAQGEATKKKLIDEAVRDGRVLPAARAAIEAFAAHAEPEALRAFLAAMPKQLTDEPIGNTPARDATAKTGSVLDTVSAKDRAWFEARGYAESIKLGEGVIQLRPTKTA